MRRVIAPFLSFLLNGLGQFYNGEFKKGFIYLGVSFVFLLILVVSLFFLFKILIEAWRGNLNWRSLFWGIILFSISSFVLCLNGLLSIVDAYKCAKGKI